VLFGEGGVGENMLKDVTDRLETLKANLEELGGHL
jgi:hypothetical protein